VSHPAIGFIGFGEAGSTIAGGLGSAGIERLVAFDVQADAPDFGPRIRQRARETRTTIVASSRELTASCDIVFSAVTSSSALEAARQTSPFLGPRHIYADLNSVSPSVKREIAEVVGASGAGFVEAAVMAPVLPYGHKVPMLLGGSAAQPFADTMTPFGMRLQVLASAGVGSAAAVKMCRSIVVKGLEALMVECVLGASRYDADDLVLASLSESFPGIDWKKLADYMTGRVVVHGERRAREMEEVADALRAVGIEPIMAEATVRRQDWSARLNLRSRFGPDGPATYRELLEVLAHIS
jgi:3-hydroxyisobutyrate dehydrogenase-like beta-hydroxyacid dehydrogenase